MLSYTDKQLAELAISQLGADRDRVYDTLATVRRAHAQGQDADFLELLVQVGVLSSRQAHKLRFAVDDTHVDPVLQLVGAKAPPPAPPPKSGEVVIDQEDILGPAVGRELRVVGPYRMLARIGEGGMGDVYRAYHETENCYVAVKVLTDRLAKNKSYVDRFHREANSVAKLNHPNIVRSLGSGYDAKANVHYLVFEYVEGPSAQRLLERYTRLSVGDAVHIILDIARALCHVHSRRIIHRDIKPDNILLTQSGVAKLSDLGLARHLGDPSSLTATRQGFGTPFYMPYEQAMNAKQANARSDIFALGATLYHLVTGNVPFPGDSPVEIVEKKELGEFPPASTHCPEVPLELDRILNKMMARYPQDRYARTEDLILDLERTGLAAAAPSFARGEESTLPDAHARPPLSDAVQPTQPDLNLPRKEPLGQDAAVPCWYIRYLNREGKLVKARMSFREVCERLKSGRLTLRHEAAREPEGKFLPLSVIPEFGNITRVENQKSKPSSKRRKAPSTPESNAGKEPAKPMEEPPSPPQKPWWRLW